MLLKTRLLSPTIICVLFCFFSCKKIAVKPIPVSVPVDIYVGGYIVENGTAGTTIDVAVYWKNGVLTKLGDGLSTTYPLGIAVTDSGVYVVGVSETLSAYPDTASAIIWKNGSSSKLAPNSAYSQAYGIAANRSDIYVVGMTADVDPYEGDFANYLPVYWKNGVPATLPNAAYIGAVSVSGSSVYFAGGINASNKGGGFYPLNFSGNTAAYWKDEGQPVTLNYPGNYNIIYSSQAMAITVSGANVFTTGTSYVNGAEFWKNTSPDTLKNSNMYSSVYGIAVSGTDIYVAGTAGTTQTYWKNNVPMNLSTPYMGGISVAYAVLSNGTDIYFAGGAAGPASPLYGAAFYWKNGVPIQLTAGDSVGAVATCIVVVPKSI